MQRHGMNLATQYHDPAFPLVNRFSLGTLPVRVRDHAGRFVAKREPDIPCQISEIRARHRASLENEP
jgi:hypothetical protein